MSAIPEYSAQRRRFPPNRERVGFIHKGKVGVQGGDIEFYVTANFFEDGTLGEVFVKIAKQGSELAGWVNAWALGSTKPMKRCSDNGVPFIMYLDSRTRATH